MKPGVPIIVFIVFILALSNLYWIDKTNAKNKKILKYKNKIELIEKILETKKYFYSFQLKSESIKLNEQEIFVDELGKILSSEQLFVNKSTLYYRFSQFGCQKCIAEDLKMIQNKFPEMIQNDLIILTKDCNLKELNQFKIKHKFNYKIYQNNNLILPLDSLNKAYFFRLTNDKKTRNIYVPLNIDKESTLYYLNFIKKQQMKGK